MEENIVLGEQEEKAEVTEIKRRPFHYWTVGETEYKMKLTTSMISKLEDKFRQSLIEIISNGVPRLSVLLTIAQAAIAPWHHGVGYSDIEKAYERWINDGGNLMEFYAKIIMPTLAVSGFFYRGDGEQPDERSGEHGYRTVSDELLKLYEPAIDSGLDFWNLSPLELYDGLKSKERTRSKDFKESIQRLFLQAELVGRYLFPPKNEKEPPHPWEYFPELFATEERNFTEMQEQKSLAEQKATRKRYVEAMKRRNDDAES